MAFRCRYLHIIHSTKMCSSNTLITALQDSSIYAHRTYDFHVIETHISWILLTGDFAYKIKKPVKFSFLDFTKLENRKFYCNEELRLNSRLAPNLYLEVVAITGSYSHPSFVNNKKPIEYAVKMRQFSQDGLLTTLSAKQQLLSKHIDELATTISNFHQNIPSNSEDDEFGSPQDLHYWTIDCFNQIETLLENKKDFAVEKSIRHWVEKEYEQKNNIFYSRKMQGFVRECHGDLHLGNMVLLDDKVVIFDGIEFNKHLYWIDVMSEIAFLVMDLTKVNYPNYSYRFLNHYLQVTGDYGGLRILKYYLVYRSIVRCKTSLLCIAQGEMHTTRVKHLQSEYEAYLNLALSYTKMKQVALIITYGLSGSGKSTYAETLSERLCAIHLRSDIERKRIYGYGATQSSESEIGEGIYTQESTEKTYARLVSLSKSIANSGFTVIMDACFLLKKQRDAVRELADNLSIPFVILELQAKENTLKNRIVSRASNKDEPSEADLDVLKFQLNNYHQLDDIEKDKSVFIDTEKSNSIDCLINQIEEKVTQYNVS